MLKSDYGQMQENTVVVERKSVCEVSLEIAKKERW